MFGKLLKKGIRKDEFDMKDVYAGPEQMMERDNITDFNMGCVYAGPEQMQKFNGSFSPISYPDGFAADGDEVQELSMDMSIFQMTYAAPDAMDGLRRNTGAEYPYNNISHNAILSGMMPNLNKTPDEPYETTVCPTCGTTVRRQKFCENCGSVLNSENGRC